MASLAIAFLSVSVIVSLGAAPGVARADDPLPAEEPAASGTAEWGR